MERLFIVLLVFAVAAHIGCWGSGSAWAEGDEALETGIDAYIYAYPLILMDATRLYIEKTTGAKDNVFFPGRAFTEAGSTDADVPVSAAWLDLSGEPMIVHMPAGRSYSLQIMDGWTNVVAAPACNGKGADFAVAGPSWYGDVPSGMIVVSSPTDMALILVRVPSSAADEDAAVVQQERVTLTPLSFYGKPDEGPVVQAPPIPTPMKQPSEQVADMDGKAFFTYFMRLFASNPPAAADAPIITELLSQGIVPGSDFDFDELDPVIRDGLSRSVGPARMRIRSSSPQAVIDPDLNASYLSRAGRAFATLVAKAPDDSVAEIPGPSDQPESEENTSPDDAILFKAEGRTGSQPGFDIREDIKRGQEFLQDKSAGHTEIVAEKRVVLFGKKEEKKERLISKRIIRPNFLLAVEDLKERIIRQVLITSRGCVTEGFHVTRTRDNGVASRFEVTYPENMAILALRTTVHSGRGLKEVVYTPYSPEIDTREVRKAGLDYLMGRIKLARHDLAAKRVRLAEFLGMGDATPMEVSLVLSIIEHIDPDRFEHYRGNEIALVHEVLTVIGANTTEAYRYSKSPAGARGLFQFVPDTYQRLRQKYRSAGLKKDFVSGSDDHINAAKASLLLFDSDLASLPRRLWSAARKNGRSIGMYLAAAYNCGPKKVEKSARECKGQWTCRLPEETRVYLNKFDAVWNVRNVLDK